MAISAAHLLNKYQPELRGGAWVIHVPLPKGAGNHWLNCNDRDHWTRRARLTGYWRGMAKEQALLGSVPAKLLDRAWVYAVCSFRTRRAIRDVGNYYPTAKACMDGITDTKAFWEDDRDGIVTGPDMRSDVELPHGITLIICPVKLSEVGCEVGVKSNG